MTSIEPPRIWDWLLLAHRYQSIGNTVEYNSGASRAPIGSEVLDRE